MQLYKNNARTLLPCILSFLNSDWLQHAHSVRGVYELSILAMYLILCVHHTSFLVFHCIKSIELLCAASPFPYLLCAPEKTGPQQMLYPPKNSVYKAKKKKKSVSQSCRPRLFFCAHLILQNSDFHFFS